MFLMVTCSIPLAVLFVMATATFTCPSLFNWYPDSKDCSKFYRCVWGKGLSFTCPSGTLWSHELLTCDYKDHVKCTKGSQTEIKYHDHSAIKFKLEDNPDFSVDYDIEIKSQESQKDHEERIAEEGKKDIESKEVDIVFLNQVPKRKKVIEHYNIKEPDEYLFKKKLKENIAVEDYNVEDEPDQVSFNKIQKKKKTMKDYVKIKPPDLSHEHKHYGNQDNEPEAKHAEVTRKHNTHHDSLFPRGNGYVQRKRESTNDELGVSPNQQYHDINQLNDSFRYNKEHENYISQKQLFNLLEAVLAFQRKSLQQLIHPNNSLTVLRKDVLLPQNKFDFSPQSSSSSDNRRQIMNKELVMNKLYHMPPYAGHTYQETPHINTDGTYDVLFPQEYYDTKFYEPLKMQQVAPTEPWHAADLFRAGYGYRRIFNKK